MSSTCDSTSLVGSTAGLHQNERARGCHLQIAQVEIGKTVRVGLQGDVTDTAGLGMDDDGPAGTTWTEIEVHGPAYTKVRGG